MKKKFNVLIIDDAFFIRGLIKKAIGAKKTNECIFEVLAEATNGKEGLDLYKMSCPDVVTVDINMPKLNGLELITEIKKINSNAQIIVISSNIDPKLQQSISKMGVNFLHKPFIENDIWNKLDLISEELQNVSNDKTENNSKEVSQEIIPTKEKVETKVEAKIEKDIEPQFEEPTKEIEKVQEPESKTIPTPEIDIKHVENIVIKEPLTGEKENPVVSVVDNNEVAIQKKKKKKKKKKNLDSDSFLEVGAIPSTMFSQYVDNKKSNNENNNQHKNPPMSGTKNVNNKVDSFLTNDTISIPVIPNNKKNTVDDKKPVATPSTKKESVDSMILDTGNTISTKDKIVKKQNVDTSSLVENKNNKESQDKVLSVKELPINNVPSLDEILLVVEDEPKKVPQVKEEAINVPSADEISLVEDKPVNTENEQLLIIEDEFKEDETILIKEAPINNVPSFDEILLVVEDEPKNAPQVKEEAINVPNADEILLVEDKSVNTEDEQLLIIDDESKEDETILIKEAPINNVPSFNEILLVVEDEPKNAPQVKEEPINVPNADEILLVEDKSVNTEDEQLLIIDDESKEDETILIKEAPINNVPSFNEILLVVEDEPKKAPQIKEEAVNVPSVDETSLVEDKSVNTDNEELLIIGNESSNFNKTVSLDIDKKPQNDVELSDIESELLEGMSYNLETELDFKTEEDAKKEEELDSIFKDADKAIDALEAVAPTFTEEDLRKQKLDELDMVLENLDSFDFDNTSTDDTNSTITDSNTNNNTKADTSNDSFNVHNLSMFGNKDLMAQTSLNNPDNKYHTSNTHGSASKMELNRGVHNYNTTNSAKTVIAPPKNNQLSQMHSEKLKNTYGVNVEPEEDEVEKKQSGGFFAKLFNLFKNKKRKNSKGEK